MREIIQLLKPIIEEILQEQEPQKISTKPQNLLDKNQKKSLHCHQTTGDKHER